MTLPKCAQIVQNFLINQVSGFERLREDFEFGRIHNRNRICELRWVLTIEKGVRHDLSHLYTDSVSPDNCGS